MMQNRQGVDLEAMIALNPEASMKKGGILKAAGPKVCLRFIKLGVIHKPRGQDFGHF